MVVKLCVVSVCFISMFFGTLNAIAPLGEKIEPTKVEMDVQRPQLNIAVESLLREKNSPLADYTDYILELSNWKLIISISAIESQYCKKTFNNYNCWGIMKSGRLRKFASYKDGAKYLDELIWYRHVRGQWLSIDKMNCSYVVPCNNNWVSVVKNNFNKLDEL